MCRDHGVHGTFMTFLCGFLLLELTHFICKTPCDFQNAFTHFLFDLHISLEEINVTPSSLFSPWHAEHTSANVSPPRHPLAIPHGL